jgi:NAD(P)-dependent dehydrogenase (short-subunit alcohol dehydrogenase family)
MKNILIIGASSGIGKALKIKLESSDYQIFTAGRSEVSSSGHTTFDANSSDSFVYPMDWPGELHGLVYCPGTINLKPFPRLSQKDFLADFQVNVLGFVTILQACLPALKRSNCASIVVFSTVASNIGLSFHASIAAAKGGLQAMAISLASELAPNKIRVNVVAPSLTETPLASGLLNTPEKMEASAKRHPLQRIGNVNDMAAAAEYFLGDNASWITGQVLVVDGGMSKLK